MRHNKIEVCHLTSVHPVGDPRILVKECTSLAMAGFKVTLVANRMGEIPDRALKAGVNLRFANGPSSRFKRLVITVPKVLWIGIKLRAKVYHIHDPELLILIPFFKLMGAKVVYDVHEDYVTSIKQKQYIPAVLRNVIAMSVRVLERLTATISHVIVAEKYYSEFFPSAVSVLNYPTDSEFDVHHINAQPVGLDTQFEWFVYAGKIGRDRGAITQLNILRDSQSTGLFYVGYCSEDLFKEINDFLTAHNIARERFQIIGVNEYVPHSKIKAILASGTFKGGLALFPFSEHYAKKELTKFFEYLQVGLPVIVSDFPVWKRFVEENRCGISLDPDRPGDLSSLDLRGMSRQCKDKCPSWKTEEAKLIALYQSLVKDE